VVGFWGWWWGMLGGCGVAVGVLVRDCGAAGFGLGGGPGGASPNPQTNPGGSLLLAPVAKNPVWAAVLIAISVAACMFTLGAAWGTCLDVGGNNAGVVSATMNTAGQVGSLLCPLMVAYTLKWFGDWNISLYVMGILFLIGVVCWLLIDPRKRIFE